MVGRKGQEREKPTKRSQGNQHYDWKKNIYSVLAPQLRTRTKEPRGGGIVLRSNQKKDHNHIEEDWSLEPLKKKRERMDSPVIFFEKSNALSSWKVKPGEEGSPPTEKSSTEDTKPSHHPLGSREASKNRPKGRGNFKERH